jgi:hypothetical protein
MEITLARLCAPDAICQEGEGFKALLTKKTEDAHRSMLVHVNNDCLSDPASIPANYVGADGKTYTVRGTSQNEALHRLLAARLTGASHIHPRTAEYLMSGLLHSFSVGRCCCVCSLNRYAASGRPRSQTSRTARFAH